jgi:FkbH-like protein/FkbM family methyltransferase
MGRPIGDEVENNASLLLGRLVESTGETKVWENELSIAAAPFLRDHSLQGINVLPGAVYVEIALAVAAEAFGRAPRILNNVVFQNMLFVPENGAQSIRATLSVCEGFAEISISAQPENANNGQEPRPAHASLNAPRESPDEGRPVLAPLNLLEIRERCLEETPGEDFYTELSKNGNQYGMAFRAIERFWRGEAEALGFIRIPKSIEHHLKDYCLHPVLLDATAQMILAAAKRKKAGALLLLGFDQIRLYGPASGRLWAHARLAQNSAGEGDTLKSDTLTGDVCLFDESGEIALELIGAQFKRMASTIADEPAVTIAVTATFTAEPLESSLAFWMKEIETPSRIVFAPYNQTFQQLLDPSSLLSENRDGVNVALIRFEDWIGNAANASPNISASGKERLFDGCLRYTLPNHLQIAHLNDYETEYLYDEIFADEVYLQRGIRINDGDCVVDVGANIGLFTLFVKLRYKNAQVYAFEPSRDAFKALETNVALYAPGVRIFNIGLSNKNESAPFTFYKRSSVFSGFHADSDQDRIALKAIVENVLRKRSLIDAEEIDALADDLLKGRLESETTVCQLKTLSAIIKEHNIDRIDLLKIDAEKSELNVLQGIEAEDWRKVRQIVVEAHDKHGETINEILSLLKEKGFEIAVDEAEILRGSGLYTVYARRRARKREGQSDHKPAKARGATERESIERNISNLVAALRAAEQKTATPHFIFVCPASPASLLDVERRELFKEMESLLAAELSDLKIARLTRSSELLEAYPVADFHNPGGEQLGHVPYSSEFFAALGTVIARKFHAYQREPYKVIALDCDQILWKGVCGEDGPFGVEIDSSRRKFQEFILRQRDAGMLIALCSKNNEEDALAVFDQRIDMPIKREHLVARRINWNPKPENIRALSNELKLGLESFIFIDDDPMECADMRAHCPQVLTLQLPQNEADIEAFLAGVWAFDHLVVTEEDKKRARSYKQNIKREESFRESLTLGAFLAGLELEVRFSVASKNHLARVAQLTQRTNQFNFTGVRRSEAELKQLLQSEAIQCLVVEVSDRFGDYGAVGAILFEKTDDAIVVDTFLLSCRALGKGVEHQMMSRLGQMAAEQGIDFVDVPFLNARKNQPALNFLLAVGSRFQQPLRANYPRLHFADASRGAGGDSLFRFKADYLANLKFDPDAEEARPAQDASLAEGARIRDLNAGLRSSSLMLKIATELRDIDQIIEAIEAQKTRQRPKPAESFLPPNNDLEQAIAGIWQEVLGIDQVGVDDKFFELGGSSLDAVLVISELKKRFDVDISTVSMFDKTTISSMAGMLKSENEEDWSEKIALRRSRGERRREKNLTRVRGSLTAREP